MDHDVTAVRLSDTGARLRHARCCKSIHFQKTLRVMNVEIIALAERTEETDGVTFDGLIKDNPTEPEQNRQNMSANLPNDSS